MAVTVALLGAVPARAGSDAWPPLTSAGPFLVNEVHQKTDGRWGAAWQTLYPAHQRIAPRAVYVRCEADSSFPAPLRSVRAVAARRTLVHIAGVRTAVPGVAVTLEIGLDGYGRDPILFRHVFHLIPVHGHWRWILSPARYRLYADKGCMPGLSV